MRQIFIIILLISLSECRKFTLNKVYNEIIEGPRDEKNAQIFKIYKDDINKDCIKDYLKLSRNGRLQVERLERIILTKAAIPKCISNEDKYFQLMINAEKDDDSNILANCFKYHLHKFEPLSPLVENFNQNLNESEIKKCEKVVPSMSSIEKEIRKEIGSLEKYTCGAITEVSDVIKFLLKIALIHSDAISDDVRKTETENLESIVKSAVYKTADCILRRIDENPEARSINNTLTATYKYDYEEDSQEDPDDPDAPKTPEDLKIARDKVNELIDSKCVKEKLNLDIYGDIQLVDVEDRIILASAELKCLKTDLNNFSKFFLDFIAKTYFVSKNFIPDSSYVLSKLEPNYELVKNYNGSSKISVDEYVAYFTEYREPYFDFKDLVGTMEEATCGVFLKYDYIKYTLKLDLLAFEENEEIRINELKKLANEVTPKIHKIADCLIAKLK